MAMAVYDFAEVDEYILRLGEEYDIRVERWSATQSKIVGGVVGGVIGGVIGGGVAGVVGRITGQALSVPGSVVIGVALGGVAGVAFVAFREVWDEVKDGLRRLVYNFLIRLDNTDIRHAMEALENGNNRRLLHLLVRAIAQYVYRTLGEKRQVVVANF